MTSSTKYGGDKVANADVNVKMGVSGVAQFKSSMQDSAAAVKTLDAALKKNEKQLQATGNAEKFLQDQASLLNQKLEAQRNIARNAEQALKQMDANGVTKTSKGYQEMQRRMIEAQTAMMDTQMELDNLGTKATDAAGKTDKLSQSLGGLNKKISLEQVIGGIDSITNAMERAAKAAVDLGKKIWENIADTARWSDDTATQAMILNMDVEDFQAYRDVFETVGEITVAEWQKARQKVLNAIHSPSEDQTGILELLGVNTHEIMQGKYGAVEGAARDAEDVFWEIGERLREKVANGEMSQDLADTYSNALFGKSFANLNPLFNLGRDAFYAAVEEQTVTSKEAIEANAELNDKLVTLQTDFKQLEAELTGGLAPAMTKAAEAIDGLLTRIIEYLQTPEGQQALENLGTAIGGLFDDLANIDPEQVVEGFTSVLGGAVDAVQWLVENKDGVVGALEAIITGWGALKITGGILDVVKLISGIRGMSTASAAAAGTAMGTSWGSAFASAVMKAAPWLIALYTLLNPSDGSDAIGNNTLIDKNGNKTNEADYYGFEQDENGEVYFRRRAKAEQAAQTAWDLYRSGQFDQQAMIDLKSSLLTVNELNDLMSIMYGARQGNANWKDMEDLNLDEWLAGIDEADIPVKPVAPEGSAEELAQEIGVVELPVTFVPMGDPTGRIRTPRGWVYPDGSHANGWSVPFDGYSAILHKGERVVPAREVGSSRNYNSNLYVESMIMNNGADAEGLAAAMAAAQKRIMSGYGS